MTTCAVCGTAMGPAGRSRSPYSGREFDLAHCPACHFSCVVEPRTDFGVLYDERYYRGEGADPLVDYEREVTDERTVREYEWRGVMDAVRHLQGLAPGTRWLDFGCGLGGLVRYARARGVDVVGHDEGHAVERLRADGVPVLTREELPGAASTFDVVTAVEVIEHLTQPLEALGTMAGLLRPGGLLLVTTGNARPHRDDLAAWAYVLPDIHVAFFEPETLATAMRAVGLEPEWVGYGPGYRDVIRYKVLKALHRRRRGVLESLVPWSLVSRVVDRRHGVSAHPVGRKR